jgi:hypothetical protein
MGSVSWRKRGNRYLVSWRLEDGSQGGKTVDTPDEARDLVAEKRLELRRGTWRGRQHGRLPFSAWAAEWWETWAADDPSPTTLAATESWLRLHVRPWFADRPIDKITPADVRRWQAQLVHNVGPSTVAHCRSLALRIFQYAMDEGAIEANPVRKVPPPTRRTGTGAAPPRPRGVLHHHTNSCRMTVTTLVRPRPGGLVGQTLAHSEGSHRAARH